MPASRALFDKRFPPMFPNTSRAMRMQLAEFMQAGKKRLHEQRMANDRQNFLNTASLRLRESFPYLKDKVSLQTMQTFIAAIGNRQVRDIAMSCHYADSFMERCNVACGFVSAEVELDVEQHAEA